MKLHLLSRKSGEGSSISVSLNRYPHFLKIWHHHPELELVHVRKSTGTRFIGDSIAKFQEGDVVLIGKSLPHMWLNDEEYFSGDATQEAEALAIHFREDFLGNDFWLAPEMRPVKELLDRAKRGVHFPNPPKSLIKDIDAMEQAKGFEAIVRFVRLLNALTEFKGSQVLSGPSFEKSFNPTNNTVLHNVYEYIFENFTQPIQSKDAAAVAKMNPAAFSRFFKRIHRCTFTQYINEIRVGYACKLLIENQYSVTQLCFDSGFNNISNFNRQFKRITKMSPTQYAKFHAKKE